jgi:hypothetical protein
MPHSIMFTPGATTPGSPNFMTRSSTHLSSAARLDTHHASNSQAISLKGGTLV